MSEQTDASARHAAYMQRAQSWYWEAEREGVRWSASMTAFGGLDIRRVDGDDRDCIGIHSSVVEDFVRFVAVLYPEAAMNGATGPDPDEETRMLAEATPAPQGAEGEV